MKKKKQTRTSAIRIEDPVFARKEQVVDGIELQKPTGGSKARRQIDSFPKRVSRHVAFVKASAVRLAKEKELLQFIVLGIIVFIGALIVGFFLHVWQLKEHVERDFRAGYGLLMSAKDAAIEQSWEEAKEMTKEAQLSFVAMKENLASLHFASSSLLAVDGTVHTVNTLLDTVLELTELLHEGITLVERSMQVLVDIQELSPDEVTQKYQNMTDFIGHTYAQLGDMRARIVVLEERLGRVELGFFPGELVERVTWLEEQLAAAERALAEVLATEPVVRTLLGDFFPKRYVVLFQNADEMRPTGGFLGSMMFISVNNGWITEQVFSDVYDIAGQVDVGIMAPPGLDTLTNRFGLQDANYFPEFVETAENILWFFDKGGAASVDGVFTINTTVIEDILRLTGPITFPVLGTEVEVTSENFTTVLSLLVEAKVDSASPKVFLHEFIEIFKTKVADISPKELFLVLRSHVEQRTILAYHRDAEVMEFFEEYAMTGALYQPQEREDFVRIVPTSISGNKSDKYIQQEVTHRTELEENGGMLVQLEIERTHTWDTTHRAMVEELARKLGVTLTPVLRGILGAGDNRNYTRVYVPSGVVLERAMMGDEVLEVDQFVENGLSVFAFTQETLVGENSVVTLVYRLPWQISEDGMYAFAAEKSSGDRTYRFFKEVLVAPEQIVSYEEEQKKERIEISEMLSDILRYEFHVKSL